MWWYIDDLCCYLIVMKGVFFVDQIVVVKMVYEVIVDVGIFVGFMLFCQRVCVDESVFDWCFGIFKVCFFDQ